MSFWTALVWIITACLIFTLIDNYIKYKHQERMKELEKEKPKKVKGE